MEAQALGYEMLATLDYMSNSDLQQIYTDAVTSVYC